MKILNYWKSLPPAQQYTYAMLSAVIGLTPLLICRILNWQIPNLLMVPCLIVAMNGACWAYAIRINNS
jgi:hypothetical protein